ncbi:MAG: protoglobin domain-containing protein [Microcystaceae cyanobacterium]
MKLNPSNFMKTMEDRMIFSTEDKAVLKSYADWGSEIGPEMSDHFYTFLQRDEEMNAIISDPPGRMERLRKTFVQWFGEMFTGIDEWGDSYAENRWHIGIIHIRLGIGPQHVVPAMATVVMEVSKKLQAEGKGDELKTALSKICMIDLAFIEQAYVEASFEATGWTADLFQRLITSGADKMSK